ncbi:hypothetical protein RFI_30049 [Reticulomyxa filosa]|uniref:Uncharacterized protein n=1 Tax=Reticulomyxa filosa TaxID=46433 RepID=X6LZJ8_RETFI|nr:hypothetical protein RFI_30049 [Reticulomyxa filosa]|eukprot:ETO07343.1 hypothetical protein RFI_30049 [Reticulomyxa filosa]
MQDAMDKNPDSQNIDIEEFENQVGDTQDTLNEAEEVSSERKDATLVLTLQNENQKTSKKGFDTWIEEITITVKDNSGLNEIKWYEVKWWRKNKPEKITSQLFKKGDGKAIVVSILPNLSYQMLAEGLDSDKNTIALSRTYEVEGKLPDAATVTCSSGRLKIQGYGQTKVTVKDEDLIQQGVKKPFDWTVDPTNQMSISGPWSTDWSSVEV